MPSGASLMTTAEHWVSVEDVAAHLGVARDSVYRWIDGRGLPAHKIGRLWKFRLSEVDDWVRAGGAVDVEPEPRSVKPTTKSRTKTTRKS
jgi:excisionase family DNA binding protein